MGLTFLEHMPQEWLSPKGMEALDLSLLPGAYLYIPEDKPLLRLEVFSHPLYHQVLYMPAMHNWTNASMISKHRVMRSRVEEGKVGSLMWLYERPYRNEIIFTFYKWAMELEDHASCPLPGLPPSMDDLQEKAYDKWMEKFNENPTELWALAKSTWTDNENIYQNVYEWDTIFGELPSGDLWMSPEEKQVRDSLPDKVVVWRGECNDGGWSWSRSKTIAEFFARRKMNESTGEVRHAVIPKSMVFGYFGEMREQEIILLNNDTAEFEIERYNVLNTKV